MTKIKITLPLSGGAITEFNDGDGNVGYTSFGIGGGGGGWRKQRRLRKANPNCLAQCLPNLKSIPAKLWRELLVSLLNAGVAAAIRAAAKEGKP